MYMLLRALCDEFARHAVAGVCTSPGSRSTPLVATLTADRRLRCFSHIDERAAGFFAVGLARATGEPVLLTCTSGTAAANYLPAIIEAREARLPLIVLTADRPSELRDVGAGQTIDQLKLYGAAVVWFQEIDTVDASPERLRWIRQLACRAVAESTAGPVHLNFQLREPLVLEAPLAEDTSGRHGDAVYTASTVAGGTSGELASWLAAQRRGVIVCGERRAGSELDAAALGERLRWPVLADPQSGARTGEAAIAHYDLSLRSDAPPPGAVLRIGELPTSKPLRQWLARLDCPQAIVTTERVWPDPASVCDARFVCDRLPAVEAQTDDGWLRSWRSEDERIAALIEAELAGELSEPAIARAVATVEGTLVVAASMPIRDVETFAPLTSTRVIANRGANGIDGTISTAYGVAATREPTTLLTGDVAFAHDVGGLLAGTRLGLDLTIVLVDNGGGGIFDFLPVSAIGDAYEEHVATPPGISVTSAAAAFGAGYTKIETLAQLRGALTDQRVGTRILHCRTDRAANVALHRRIASLAGG